MRKYRFNIVQIFALTTPQALCASSPYAGEPWINAKHRQKRMFLSCPPLLYRIIVENSTRFMLILSVNFL